MMVICNILLFASGKPALLDDELNVDWVSTQNLDDAIEPCAKKRKHSVTEYSSDYSSSLNSETNRRQMKDASVQCCLMNSGYEPACIEKGIIQNSEISFRGPDLGLNIIEV